MVLALDLDNKCFRAFLLLWQKVMLLDGDHHIMMLVKEQVPKNTLFANNQPRQIRKGQKQQIYGAALSAQSS